MAAELRELPTFRVEAQEDVVRILEQWLELARAGELVGVAICGVREDRVTTTTQWSTSTSFPTLVGASAIMMHEMAREASK